MLLDRFRELVERDHAVCGDIDACPFTFRWGFQDLHLDRQATGGKTNSSCMRGIWGRICPLTELLAVSKHVFILTVTWVKASKDTWLYHDSSLVLHLIVISFSLRIAIRTKSIWIEITTLFRQSMASLPTLPVAVLLRIFSELDGTTVFVSVRDVCQQLRAVVNTHHWYELDLTLLSKPDFHRLFTLTLLCRESARSLPLSFSNAFHHW